jgi:hypothetical protein
MIEQLRDAFEADSYEISEISENRGLFRVAVLEEDASAAELTEIVNETVSGEPFGIDVTTETIDGGTEVSTVISFRMR